MILASLQNKQMQGIDVNRKKKLLIILPFPYNGSPSGGAKSIILISGIPETIPIII